METASRYASERDFVANYVLPELKEAAKTLEVSDIVEFHVEKPVNGTADLTADRGGRGLFLIEAKFKKKVGKVTHDIEPRDPAVITQAANYAVNGGYGYYATCNVKRLILFQLAPKKPIECEVSSFEYEAQPEWAKELLKLVLGKVPLKLKQLDDALVDTLLEAHRDLYPRVYQSFQKKLGEKNFKEKYIDWLESQGLQLNDATNRLVAEQATYLQITKLLFYGVVQSLYPAKLKPLRIGEEEEVPQALQRFYEDVKKIDYMPIYQTDIISEIPLSVGAEERVRTLVDTIAEFDFSQMKRDFLSRVYEKLIPPIERKRLGQFYTPPGIVEFILQLTLKDPNAMVLDPGCGSGTFLIGAYNHLRDLNGIPQSMEGGMGERFHQQLLNQVYGIDINQFPAHLSVVGLAIQNPRAKVDKINVVVKDFFDIKRGQATLTGFETLDASGQETVIEFPSYFDVVVANPPYIRQELLGTKEKDKIRKLIEWDYSKATYKAYIGAPPKKSFNGIVLDKQSDIFIYFFIHGISLLRNSGKLGFISSNKWLEVGYGEPFQQFLLNNCKILYVVEFDRAIFPDADVNTAVTILEKCEDKSIRSKNTVRFVRLKRRMEIDIFRDVISKATEGSEDDNMRIILVQQSELEAGKWNVYLRAPKVYQQIVKNSRVKPLGSLITDIFRGPVTGYNEYFIIPKHRAKELGIEPRYLKPCVSSPKKIKGIAIYKEDIDEYFFMVNQPKDELKGTNALEYIQWGEKLEVDVTRGANRGRRKLP
ncbi:MAG: N-6 DNA methylase, partial [Thaumarchaeota archaeon]|nr:N-6 DNA methylase [Nitrososphaerota archaeon]